MNSTEQSENRISMVSWLFLSLATFTSGAAALSHELLWTRRLVDLLGATDTVVARVLGMFFLGLAIGGFMASRIRKSTKTTFVYLCQAEVAVMLFSLPAALLPFWTDWIWPAVGPEFLTGLGGTILKLLLAVFVVIPPAIAMGLTLPFFIRVFVKSGTDSARSTTWIYALNTLGGVAGLWLTSSVLIQAVGAQNSMFCAAGMNGLAILFIGLTARKELFETHNSNQRKPKSKKSRDVETNPTTETLESDSEENQAPLPFNLICWSLASGFFIMSFEVVLLKILALVVPSSFHTTSALLANVIILLAFGSAVVSFGTSLEWVNSLFDTPQQFVGKTSQLVANAPKFLGWVLLCSGIAITACPYLLHFWTDELISIRYMESLNDREISSISQFWWLIFGLLVVTGGPTLICLSLVFPTLLTVAVRSESSTKSVGTLLAANGLGGIVGTEVTNGFLVANFGPYLTCSVLAFVFLLAAFLILAFKPADYRRLLFSPAIFAGLFGCLAVGGGFLLNRDLPYISPNASKDYQLIARHFARDGVYLVVVDEKRSKSILSNGQYVLGSSSVALDQKRQLLIPWMLNPTADSVCSMGLATGISATGLDTLKKTPPITAVELSPTVVALARKYFSKQNRSFFRRSRNKVVVEDARTYIAATENQFDIIVGDLYRPHGAGEARLFSKEHFQNVRGALTENGLFCQWLPIYQMNFDVFQKIAATYQSVFPNTLVVYGNRDAKFPVLGLIATKNDRIWSQDSTLGQIRKISNHIGGDDPLISSFPELIVGNLLPSKQTLNTLDNLEIEIEAGDFWITKDLRRNRNYQFEKEFITGRALFDFNKRLLKLTKPIVSRTYFRQFNEKLFLKK